MNYSITALSNGFHSVSERNLTHLKNKFAKPMVFLAVICALGILNRNRTIAKQNIGLAEAATIHSFNY